MAVRTIVLATTVALACAVPSQAMYVGAATRFGGMVASSSDDLGNAPASSDIGAEQVAGQCTYTGQTTTDGRMQYQFFGEAVSSSTSTSQPQLTDVTCTLTSPAQGLPGELPTQTTHFEAACPLAACVSAGLVSGWPARPVVVCVDGYSVYGPTPVKTATVRHACKTSTL